MTLETNIIKELGLDELPEGTQAEILAKITEVVLKRITVDVLEKLSEGEIAEFEKLQETASQEELDAFLKSKIDNYDQLVQETVSGFKEEFKDTVEQLKDSLK